MFKDKDCGITSFTLKLSWLDSKASKRNWQKRECHSYPRQVYRWETRKNKWPRWQTATIVQSCLRMTIDQAEYRRLHGPVVEGRVGCSDDVPGLVMEAAPSRCQLCTPAPNIIYTNDCQYANLSTFVKSGTKRKSNQVTPSWQDEEGKETFCLPFSI